MTNVSDENQLAQMDFISAIRRNVKDCPQCKLLKAKIEQLDRLTMSAWGLIANAYEGNWDLASEASGWKEAAERWRDEFHTTLPSVDPGKELDKYPTEVGY